MRKTMIAVAAASMLFFVGTPGAASAAPATAQATVTSASYAANPVACKTRGKRSIFGGNVWQSSPRKKLGEFRIYTSADCKSVWGVLEKLTRSARGKKFTVRAALYSNSEATWLGNVPPVTKKVGRTTKSVAGNAIAHGGGRQCVEVSVSAPGVPEVREGCARATL